MPDLSDKVSELAPCPFCGGKAAFSHPYRYQAICEACGARGPITKNAGDIEGMRLPIATWNRRTRLPASSMEGWRLVPEKSTDEMHKAYTKAKYEGPKPVLIPDLWVAMLAASPIPPERSA